MVTNPTPGLTIPFQNEEVVKGAKIKVSLPQLSKTVLTLHRQRRITEHKQKISVKRQERGETLGKNSVRKWSRAKSQETLIRQLKFVTKEDKWTTLRKDGSPSNDFVHSTEAKLKTSKVRISAHPIGQTIKPNQHPYKLMIRNQ